MKGIPELIAAIAAEDNEMAHAVAPTLLKLDKDIAKWNEGRPGKKNLSVPEILAGAMGKMGRGGDTALEFVNPDEQKLLAMAGSQRSRHPVLGVTENYYGSYGDESGDGDSNESEDYSDSELSDVGIDPGDDPNESEDYTDSELADVGIDPDDLPGGNNNPDNGNTIEDMIRGLGDNIRGGLDKFGRPGQGLSDLFGIQSRGGRQGAAVGQSVGGIFGGAALGALGSVFDSLREAGVDVDYSYPEGEDEGNSANNPGDIMRLAQTPTSLPDAIEMPQGLNLTGTPMQQRAQLATLALYGGQGQGVARSKAGQDFYRNLAARTLTGDNERLPIDIQYMRDILGETV